MLAHIGVRTDQRDYLLRAIRRAVDSKSHAHASGFHDTRYARRHFPDAAFQDSSKLKGLNTAGSDPDVGIASIDKPRCRSEEARQEAALKDHQEHGKTHPQYGYREACSNVNYVLPSEVHKEKLALRQSGTASSTLPRVGICRANLFARTLAMPSLLPIMLRFPPRTGAVKS